MWCMIRGKEETGIWRFRTSTASKGYIRGRWHTEVHWGRHIKANDGSTPSFFELLLYVTVFSWTEMCNHQSRRMKLVSQGYSVYDHVLWIFR